MHKKTLFTPIIIIYYALFVGISYSADVNFASEPAALSGSINGICFNDLNKNRRMNPNETGIEGVIISLKKINLPFFKVIDAGTDETGADGSYDFSDLSMGLYAVIETDPEASQSTTRNIFAVFVGPFKANKTINFGDFLLAPPAPDAPTVSLSAEPQIIQPGESSVLSWASENADTVWIDPDIGEVAAEGSREVFPEVTTTYNITSEGEGGTAQGFITVLVVTPPPAPTVTISADSQTAQPGQIITLTWNATHADSVGLSHVCAGIDYIDGPVEPKSRMLAKIYQTTTYIITAVNQGGAAVADVTVIVDTPTQEDSDLNYPEEEAGTLVELSSFSASAESNRVIVEWTTESEIDTAGFNLYRAEENSEFIKINDSLIPAEGGPTTGALYDFVDEQVENRKAYYYILEDMDINGLSTLHDAVKAFPRLVYAISGI